MSEILYNGISKTSPWPPRIRSLTSEPVTPRYISSPPDTIPIDVGRQLFVDDFLIEDTTLSRTYHVAEYYPDNPVLKPDQPWENEGGSTAMVFSDGVWYDPKDHLYKMWYMGGYGRYTCYATSQDGISWEKPVLDLLGGTNVVHAGFRDSGTVWLDLEEEEPQRRYKMFISHGDGGWSLSVYFSADGIHWGEAIIRSGSCGDRTTAFRNPFRKVWAYSIRDDDPQFGRIRRYWEGPDVITAARWGAGEPLLWTGADDLDPRHADLQRVRPQLYNLDAVAYESILLGLFSVWRGQPSDRPKLNEVVVGYSRDGFHWHRPSRRAFIPLSEQRGDWNWGNVQSAGGCCLVVGDQLRFYVSGRAGVPGSPGSGLCSTGLAILRRDGFASMDAGESGGTLTTRPVRFRGKHLFVNVAALSGELRAEVLNERGSVIEPFSRENCVPLSSDKTLQAIRWNGANDLSTLVGRRVKFRFYLREGRLYAFWVSAEPSGASHGYVAAGGPGFTGPTDTVGSFENRR